MSDCVVLRCLTVWIFSWQLITGRVFNMHVLALPTICCDESASRVLLNATGDEAGGLRVWDLELGDCTGVLAGHSGAINALSIASAGNVLVSAASDGTCRVWDLQQGGACRCALVGHTGSVKAVAVEPKGRFCITAGADGSARVWSLATAACALILQDSEDDGHPG